MFCNTVRRLVLTAILTTTAAIAACGRDMPVGPVSIGGSSIGASSDLVSPMGITQLQVGQSLALPAPSGFSRNRNYEWASDNPSVIVVNSSGVVYAVGPGAATITASSAGVAQQYVVSVQGPSVIGYTLTPKTGTPLPPGATRQFVPEVWWSDGAPRSAITAWELPLGGGSISQLGAFTAGSMAGTFLVVAHCVCGLVDSAFVEVSEPAQLQKLTISPKSVTLAPGEERQFTVSANWSTGATDAPPVVWSATGGSVSAGGVYVAPGEAGSYRVVVRHAGGVAADTAVVTVNSVNSPPQLPPPGGTAEPFFADDFDNGKFNSRDGFTWKSGVKISSERSYSGDYSMKFPYKATPLGDDSSAEQRFDMGRYLPELWIEYMIYIPSNFRHRVDLPSNDKFIMVWKDTYGSLSGTWQIGWEYDRNGDTESHGRFMSSRWDEDYVTSSGVWPEPAPLNRMKLISKTGPLVIGQWNSVRLHFKAASSPRGEDGVSELWVNGKVVFSYFKGRFHNFNANDPVAALRNGYFMGWANSGFDEQTDFFIDDVRFYSISPGW